MAAKRKGPGRPPIPLERKRVHLVKVALTLEEMQRLVELAGDEMLPGELARSMVTRAIARRWRSR